MQQRKPGIDLALSPLGLGCMGMSEFYGPRDDKQALQTLEQAVEMGINFFDTADMYGPHHNEELLGHFLKTHRHHVHIATKFGIVRKPGEYQRTLDNSPAYARQSCEASLRRLGIEQIDLYYVHRLDPNQPVEETMAGLIPLAQGNDIIPIPGTKRLAHLQDNLGALSIHLESHEIVKLHQALDTLSVLGERYTAEGMKGVNA